MWTCLRRPRVLHSGARTLTPTQRTKKGRSAPYRKPSRTLGVTVPVNTTATVHLPYTQGVLLDGQPPPPAGADGGYPVGSGTYVFTAQAM
jgi:hypothetical protein